VFHSTPGRLTGDGSFLDISTPRPLTSSVLNSRLSGDFDADTTSHVHHLSENPGVTLPPGGGSIQAPSSPKPYPIDRFDDSTQKVTPRKPRKRLEEAFSGQTATPPQSVSKGTRKLAPKILTENMQNDSQNGHYGISDTPIHEGDYSAFPPTSIDMFGYPMSAPATASLFTNKPFWDPDSSMGGMELDFTAEDAAMFVVGSHRNSNSFDWGRSNQVFQESMNIPPQTQEEVNVKQPVKRQRPLAPKVTLAPNDLPKAIPPFQFNNNNNNNTSVSEDPFSLASMNGSVDPGLLFSRNNSISMTSDFADVALPPPRPATSGHVGREPYQHQQRELRRDQEELRQSRSSRERSSGRSFDRQTVSSPVKGSARPGLHRSASDSRGKRSQGELQGLILKFGLY